jgi:hypothetical protein
MNAIHVNLGKLPSPKEGLRKIQAPPTRPSTYKKSQGKPKGTIEKGITNMTVGNPYLIFIHPDPPSF